MVVALPSIWGWKWCGDADSRMGCEMDGGPCVVIRLVYVCLEGCVTGLPGCWLGCGYDLAYSSGWWIAMGGGFALLYPGWVVYFVIPVWWPDTRTSVYESREWYFSRCTAG